ncbi:MAG: type VII secretion integral membrane protein EccD [Actinomycetia bacterium]|nr:type VII secretion integral membrane protein EccD [Actinomycetes bacterium]
MSDALCRLVIHAVETGGTEASSTVDLTLPADCPVAVLIPPVADVVLKGSIPTTDPRSWNLTRIGGEPLDTAMTLRENTVHDGELLALAPAPLPSPRRRSGDSSRVVAEAASHTPAGLPHGAVTIAAVTVTLVSAATLAWTGRTVGTATHLWTAAALSAAAATSVIVTGRTDQRASLGLSLAAVVFATVTGFLAGPNTAWAPALLLAASSGFAVSILLLHMAGAHTAMLNAFAAGTGAFAAAGLIGVTADLPFGAVGAVLAVLSLTALSAAPKLTVAAAALGPSRPEIGDRRAVIGHRMLTGLVAGWSCSATLGASAVAAAPGGAPPAATALFAADVGLLLLLRQRSHLGLYRRVTLGAAGLCASAAAFLVAANAAPGHASWLCAVVVAVAMAVLRWGIRPEPPNPVVRQGLQILEYLALTAVVPLAAWATGVYGLVRDLSLP